MANDFSKMANILAIIFASRRVAAAGASQSAAGSGSPSGMGTLRDRRKPLTAQNGLARSARLALRRHPVLPTGAQGEAESMHLAEHRAAGDLAEAIGDRRGGKALGPQRGEGFSSGLGPAQCPRS